MYVKIIYNMTDTKNTERVETEKHFVNRVGYREATARKK